jgi:hypothetical protein
MPAEPLTYEEHRDLGEELLKTRRRLQQLSRMALDVYGANNRCAFTFEKLDEAMDRLIGELARQSVVDCPGKDAESLYRRRANQ